MPTKTCSDSFKDDGVLFMFLWRCYNDICIIVYLIIVRLMIEFKLKMKKLFSFVNLNKMKNYTESLSDQYVVKNGYQRTNHQKKKRANNSKKLELLALSTLRIIIDETGNIFLFSNDCNRISFVQHTIWPYFYIGFIVVTNSDYI